MNDKPSKGQKRAYLIFGPESSGSRLAKRILMAAGCEGTDQNIQKWDSTPPTTQPLIVWHRSFPNKSEWPDINKMVNDLRKKGYWVGSVVTFRDWFSMTISGCVHHAKDITLEKKRARRAYSIIFSGLDDCQVPFIPLSYEGLMAHPKKTITWLLRELHLNSKNAIKTIKIKNGNSKYYKNFESRFKSWV